MRSAVPMSNVGLLQDSQGRQQLAQQIPDDLITIGLFPKGPPPGTGLHHGDPLHPHVSSMLGIKISCCMLSYAVL